MPTGNGGHTTAVFAIDTLTLSPGANYHVELNGTTVGTGYDRVSLGGGGAANAVIARSNLFVHVGFAVMAGQQFTIMRQGSGFGGQQFAQGTTVTADNGNVFSVTYSGDDIVLTLTAAAPVPEPSTWIGGALAIAVARFHAAPQTAEVDGAALCDWLLNGR